jgi:Raf kinase inhibitor-like YbhB/YbcL family protein
MRYLSLCLAVLFGPIFAHGADAMSLTLTSSAFAHGEEIPSLNTCDGADRSPALSWSRVPAGTKGLALVVDDPDAPRWGGWVHWVIYDLPPDTTALAEGVTALPPGAREGLNDWRRTGYGGPCPPRGRHRYFFKLYALDRLLGDLGRPTRQRLERAMAGHVLGRAELMGTYQRRQ